MVIWPYIIEYFICYISAFSILLVGMAIYNKPFTWKRLWIALAIVPTVTCLRNYCLGGDSALGMGIQLLLYPLLSYFAFDQRGLRVAFGSTFHFAVMLLLETSFALFAMWRLWTPDVVALAKSPLSALSMTINLTTALVITLGALGVLWVCRTFRGSIRLEKPWIYVIRPILLSIVTLGMLFVSMLRLSEIAPGERIVEMCAICAMVAVLLLLSAVYVHQDAQLLKIARSNESLVRQQKIYDTLLADTRAFRHNIANLLYGFEGAILTGDMNRIREYYDQMARRCARINNENIVALNRIPSPPVCALLLNKLSRAADGNIPMYLLAEDNLRWQCLPEEDFCQALGALIDNALEAATDSRTPYVAVEFDNFEGAMEVAVRNTFDGEKADLGFLTGEAQTKKPGHEGIGLRTVRDILSRYDRAALNQMRRGRYVESLLLIE